jgi:molybdopterin converting factor small subunit
MIRVRYFAAAREAAGTSEESWPVTTATTVADLLTALSHDRGDQLAQVIAHCSVLVDGARAHLTDPLPDHATVDLLPPFAGG